MKIIVKRINPIEYLAQVEGDEFTCAHGSTIDEAIGKLFRYDLQHPAGFIEVAVDCKKEECRWWDVKTTDCKWDAFKGQPKIPTGEHCNIFAKMEVNV